MKRVALDGLELEYELRGAGEPVVLIHWGCTCNARARPLLEAPALCDRFRLLSYDRAGFGGSSSLEGPVALAGHADHCRQLMHQLGLERAHIVGHSSSAMIALQLALDAPEAVQTLALLESAAPQRRHARDRGPIALPRHGFTRCRARRPALSPSAPARGRDTSSSRRSSSSARTASRRSPSGASCCSRGCRTPSRSTCPARRTCCTCRTPPAWPMPSPRSSPAIRCTDDVGAGRSPWEPASPGARRTRPAELPGLAGAAARAADGGRDLRLERVAAGARVQRAILGAAAALGAGEELQHGLRRARPPVAAEWWGSEAVSCMFDWRSNAGLLRRFLGACCEPLCAVRYDAREHPRTATGVICRLQRGRPPFPASRHTWRRWIPPGSARFACGGAQRRAAARDRARVHELLAPRARRAAPASC